SAVKRPTYHNYFASVRGTARPSIRTLPLLSRRGGHRRRVMVDDHPVLTVLHEGEAIACWQSLGFSVLDVPERVVAGGDRVTAINADQLLAERHFETWQDLKRRDEVVAQRCSIRSHGWGERTPENSISGIEKNNLVRVVLS